MITKLPKQRGFTLIEALTALLVTAFGMLAIGALQSTLSYNSDVAKQRSEAVRLAQLKLEELRAYEQTAADGVGNKFDYTDDVVSGTDTVSPSSGSYVTNTAYARTWTVTGNGTDLQKWIRVEVNWADRNGATQTVALQSVIARADVAAIGTLAVGPGGMKVRTPKNRSVDIPYPAISLAGEKSGFWPPGGDKFYIFSNLTGDVLGHCNSALAEGATVNFDETNCFQYSVKALLLTGYIRFVYGSYSLSDLENPTAATKELTAAVDLTVGTSASCSTQRQKVVSAGNIAGPENIISASRASNVVTVTTGSNHGYSTGQFVSINGAANTTFNGVFRLLSASGNTFTYSQIGANASFTSGTPPATAVLVQEVTIAETDTAPPGYNTVKSTFVAYTCVVVPADHDSNPSTPNRWTGRLRVTPAGSPSWSLGESSGAFKVCRYTGDYVSDGSVSNSENPLWHRGVTGALDHQNFVVIDGNRDCRNDSAANTATGKYTNLNTTVHQTALDGSGGDRSGTNSGNANNNGGISTPEPSDTSVALPMF